MKLVVFKKYIKNIDDTEFSFIICDNNGDVTAHVQYLCNNGLNYNRTMAKNCTLEKFDKIIEMKKTRSIELLFEGSFDVEKKLDDKVNELYTLLRKEKGLEACWFNGHGL